MVPVRVGTIGVEGQIIAAHILRRQHHVGEVFEVQREARDQLGNVVVVLLIRVEREVLLQIRRQAVAIAIDDVDVLLRLQVRDCVAVVARVEADGAIGPGS